MNKQYNVDDILLEIKSKKKQGSAGISAPAGFPMTKKAEAPKAAEPVQEEPKENPLTGFQFNVGSPVKEKEEKPNIDAFSFKKTVSVPKEELPVKKQETFKVTIPEEEKKKEVDYNKYFTNLKDDNEADSFKFKTPAFTPDVDPMEATREVSFKSPVSEPQAQKPAQKAPFKLNFNFDEDEEKTTVIPPVSEKPKSIFAAEMLGEEEPKRGFFSRI